MRSAIACTVAAFTLASSSCHSELADPVPAPAAHELALAAPGARGARAAGTDAAPTLSIVPGTEDPDEPSQPEGDADGGPEADAGAAAPDAGGVAL